MEEHGKLQKELSEIGAEIRKVLASVDSAENAEDKRYYRETALVLRKRELLLFEALQARVGLGVESVTRPYTVHAAGPVQPPPPDLTPQTNPTTAYLEDCLKPPAAGRGTLCAMLLHGDVEDLQKCLATPVALGLPLPPFAAAEMPRSLRHKLVPETQQATPNELSMHVYGAVCDDLQPAGTGCSSEMYTAFLTHRLLERTWWLIAKHQQVTWLDMDRNVAGASGAQAAVRLQRPDFMVWVKKALLFKGEEKAASRDLPLAVDELTSNTTEAWAAGLLPAVPRPRMLAYAAAGSRLQFFCLIPSALDSTGKRTGDGSSSSAGSGSRRVRAEPISTVLELRSLEGRLAVVTAAFNIWRLLDDYANSGQLVPALPIGGQSIKSAGSHVSFHPGYVRKTIPDYRLTHERYVSFELLARLYERLRGPQHRHAIIKASQLPRLDADGTYVVHLAPLGRPCTGPPDTEEELAAAVAGVLRGLAALHAEGYVHRDVRWANVIYLPEDGRWMLIDLEHAGLEGCDCSRSPFPLRHWSPRTLPPNKVYRAASDLRMAAEQLMCGGLRFTLSDAASDLREQLMRAVEADNGGSGGSGLTAEQALKHPWLAAAAAGPW